MRKILTALMLSLSTLPVLAQEAPKPDPTQLYSLLDGRTIVKTDPLSMVVGNLNLQVERLLAHGVSAQLGLYFTPQGDEGTQSGAFHYRSYALSNSIVFSPEQPKHIAISPQIRWYLNGGLGHGFYIQGYYRFQHSDFTRQHIYAQHKVVDDKMQYISVDYDGQATTTQLRTQHRGTVALRATEEHRLRLAHPRCRTWLHTRESYRHLYSCGQPRRGRKGSSSRYPQRYDECCVYLRYHAAPSQGFKDQAGI